MSSLGPRQIDTLRQCVIYALLAIFGATMVLPLLWMVSTSLKAPEDHIGQWLPSVLTFSNYGKVFEEVPFGRFYLNSFVVAAIVTVGQVVTSALAAYAFARLRFPGRNKIFLAYLATMMIPSAIAMVPLYMIFYKFPDVMNWLLGTSYFSDEVHFLGGWLAGESPTSRQLNRWSAGVPLGIDSYFALIAPALFSAYGTFMLRQFFLGIPRDLEDAAEIDGCSRMQIFRWVIVPLSKPALATLAIFTFMNNWRNFMWPLIMTNRSEMKTLPVGLSTFMDMHGANWPLLMAGATMMIVPMILVFLVCQKWFISGIQLGAVKG